jgi:GNAT superfamily N-acetyltransferase
MHTAGTGGPLVLEAMRTDQSDVAIRHGLAHAMAPAVGRFAALDEDTERAWQDLGRITDTAIVERDADFEPTGWTLERRTALTFMFTTTRSTVAADHAGVVDLGVDDVPAMVGLATLGGIRTFAPGSVGRFAHVGVVTDGQLVAMAGARFSTPEWQEIACVVTHPDHRGQGHARVLVDLLVARARRAGRASCLRVEVGNPARQVYERMGFVAAHTTTVDLRRRARATTDPTAPVAPGVLVDTNG